MKTLVTPAVALILTLGVQDPPATARLGPGMVITQSTRIAPGTYRIPSGAIDRPALIVRGQNLTIDLTGVTLEGGEPDADPDTYTGAGIVVDAAPGVTIRGGTIRGYKIGILAQRSPRLQITGADVSFNWKPRLRSGIEQEHQGDWLSFHDNEQAEWLRYGAAIYLTDSDDAEIDHNRAVQGMNGLMATRSSRLRIWNNTFSWLSGLGIGLYRTTDSRIMHNKLDWCVRGYSHGFYNRGQDSAGLLMYEQSSRNIVAFNSITHGGDGVFLWAGQSTMDTGQDGSNDNLFHANDVSHAVANGIEATFSRNRFVGNRIDDSWHGIWGGYSYDSVIADNSFAGNTEGIAIEHGQNIRIHENTFTGDETAIRLWANARQDPNWGYPKHRDTRSRDYEIARNTFVDVTTALHVTRTAGVTTRNNRLTRVATPVLSGPDAPPDLVLTPSDVSIPEVTRNMPAALPAGMNAMLPPGARRGRETIIVDEWGPYDYRSPKLWPAGSPGDRPLRLRVLGPGGRWTVASIRGATAQTTSGTVPGEVALAPEGAGADLSVVLSYTGAEVVTPRGRPIPAGQAYRFSYTLFEPAIQWTVRFWRLDAESDPLARPAGFRERLKTPPLRTEALTRLAYATARSFGEDYRERFAVVAEGVVSLPPGSYALAVTSDDGVRVWIDDRLVLEDWSIHGPKEDRLRLAGGSRRIRIEYFQNTGAAALMARIVRP